jgi:hypothetical protein
MTCGVHVTKKKLAIGLSIHGQDCPRHSFVAIRSFLLLHLNCRLSMLHPNKITPRLLDPTTLCPLSLHSPPYLPSMMTSPRSISTALLSTPALPNLGPHEGISGVTCPLNCRRHHRSRACSILLRSQRMVVASSSISRSMGSSSPAAMGDLILGWDRRPNRITGRKATATHINCLLENAHNKCYLF